MSYKYTVLLAFTSQNTPPKLVYLNEANIDELRNNIPFNATMSQTHAIKLLDSEDCEIESNDDLITLFDYYGRHDAIITVVMEQRKQKQKTYSALLIFTNDASTKRVSFKQAKLTELQSHVPFHNILSQSHTIKFVDSYGRNIQSDEDLESLLDVALTHCDTQIKVVITPKAKNNNDDKSMAKQREFAFHKLKRTVFVYGIPSYRTEQDVRKLLSSYGRINELRFESNTDPEAPNKRVAELILRHKRSIVVSDNVCSHLTSAFVIFENLQQAGKCVKARENPTKTKSDQICCMTRMQYIQYSNTVTRNVGQIVHVDKVQRIAYLKPYTFEHAKPEHRTFSFDECNGFDLRQLTVGTLVEYDCYSWTQTAVRISLYLLNYQWLRLDKKRNIWQPSSMQESKRLDEEHKVDVYGWRQHFRAGDYFRTTRFQRKVHGCTMNGGFVEVNYNEQLQGVFLPFSVNQVNFDFKFVENGDEIVYQLQKVHHPKPMWKVVNIAFANLPTYKWQQSSKSDPFNWSNVPLRQNFVLENRFNIQSNLRPFRVIFDGNKQYRRLDEFLGRIQKSPSENNPGRIGFVYDQLRGTQANAEIDYDPNQCLNKREMYVFHLVPNTPGLCGFKAINIRSQDAPRTVTGKVGHNVNHNINNSSNHSNLKSSKIVLTVLPYRWLRNIPGHGGNDNKCRIEGRRQTRYVGDGEDSEEENVPVAGCWQWCSYEESQQYEQQHNPMNQDLPDQYVVAGSFRRMKRFTGRVLKVMYHQTMGFVEPNYEQQDPRVGIAFYYKDFINEHINSSNPLRKGYQIEYELKFFTKPKAGFRAVKIKIASRDVDADNISVASSAQTDPYHIQETEHKDASPAFSAVSAQTAVPGAFQLHFAAPYAPSISSPVAAHDHYRQRPQRPRYVDKILEINKSRRQGVIMCTALNTMISFDLNSCVNGNDLNKDFLVEYSLNAQRNAAVDVSVAILTYGWQEMQQHSRSKKYVKCSYEKCVEYENQYNANHIDLQTELKLDGKILKRFTRFIAKIKRLNEQKTHGWVLHDNRYMLKFDSGQCDFNNNFLNVDDMLSYEIERIGDTFQCVRVKFLPIPYMWQYQAAADVDKDDDWTNCNVQMSKEMERKYFTQYKHSRRKDIVVDGKRYRRTTQFTGTIHKLGGADKGLIKFDLEDAESDQDEEDDDDGILHLGDVYDTMGGASHEKSSNYVNLKIEFDLAECKGQQFDVFEEVQFNMHTEDGTAKAINLCKPGYEKRKIGQIVRIDKAQKVGFVKKYDFDAGKVENGQEYPFKTNECNGFHLLHVSVETLVEYELRFDQRSSTLYAVSLCLYLLPYQWLAFDKSNDEWKANTMQQSKKWEEMNKKGSDRHVRGDRLRVTKFQRKVKDLQLGGGLVEVNHNNQARNVFLPFRFQDVQFDPKLLRNGDEVIYQLKRRKHPRPIWTVVNIEFANFIPYFWQSSSLNGSPKWFNVPFLQNFALERRCKASSKQLITDRNAKYRRRDRFRGKIVRAPQPQQTGKILVFYERALSSLQIDVEYDVNQSYEKDSEYYFNIAPNTKGLVGFKAINIEQRVNFEQHIFQKLYNSKFLGVGWRGKTGKVAVPSELMQYASKKKTKRWQWEDSNDKYVAYDQDISDKLDKLSIGESMTYSAPCSDTNSMFGCMFAATQQTYTLTKLSEDGGEQINQSSLFTRKIKRASLHSDDNLTQCMTFRCTDCRGFNASELSEGCLLQFHVTINKQRANNHLDEDFKTDGDFPLNAIKVQLPRIDYQWQRYSSEWIGETRAKSAEYEQKYNAQHRETEDEFVTGHGSKIRRITTFKSNVLKIDPSTRRGQVRIHYSDEYGDNVGLWFGFRNCKFNPFCLRVGDEVEYNVQEMYAVNVKLWLLPYRWKYRLPHEIQNRQHPASHLHRGRSLGNMDENDVRAWQHSFSYHECKKLEERYHHHNDDDCKDVNYAHNGQTVIARRTTWFRSRAIFDESCQNQCILHVSYNRDERLAIKVPYIFPFSVPADIWSGTWVEFEIKRDTKKKQWIIHNVQKAKWFCRNNRDSQTHIAANKQIADLQRQLNHFRLNTAPSGMDGSAVGGIVLPDGDYYEADYDALDDEEIKSLFFKTVSKSQYEIESIEDVKDDKQCMQYEINLYHKCEQLKRPRSEVEKYLFHGSSFDTLQVIVQNGFDRSYSTTAAYGSGTYFARDASYSANNRYSPPHTDGYQYMFLCRVIVGDSTLGSSGINRIPKKSDNTEYDTLVDNTSDPSIVVVWRDYCAVPVYRIKFKRKYGLR